MQKLLEGKKAIITGGLRGIGRVTALKLAQEGADVALINIGDDTGAETVKAAIMENNVKSIALKCAPAKYSDVVAALNAVRDEFGGIDIIVNNTADMIDCLAHKITSTDFNAITAKNINDAYTIIKLLFQYFIEKKSGKIVNIGIANDVKLVMPHSDFQAARASMLSLTKRVALELTEHNVFCNAVVPGYTDSDIMRSLPEERREQIINTIPAKRLAAFSEIANAVVYMASDLADYISGIVIKVDGARDLEKEEDQKKYRK